MCPKGHASLRRNGNADNQSDIDKAVAIAKNTEGVVTVKNHLKIRKDA